MNRHRAVCTVLLLLAAIVHAQSGLVIGEITIRTDNVYAPNEVGPWGTRLANSIHFTTREQLIRSMLLTEEGDPYDRARLEETERNLRRLPFIKSARVVAGEPHDGHVDLEVITQDSWSLEPGLSFGQKGGESHFSFDVTERNLLGRALEVRFGIEENPDRSRQILRLRDHALLGPYWTSELRYSDNSDGSEQRLVIERPFYSTETPWSFLFFAENLEQRERLYDEAVEAASFAVQRQRLTVGLGRRLAATSSAARRLSFGVDLDRVLFSPYSGDLGPPADRDFRYIWLELEQTHNNFRELTYVDRAEQVEDFNLGFSASLRFGLSPTFLGAAETTGLVSAEVASGLDLGPRAILLLSGGFSSRIGAVNHNTIASTEARWIHRIEGRRPQVSIARMRLDRGWDLDPDVQLFADGENGLRGYRLHAFEGDSRLLINAEHRIFLGHELFKLVSPGLTFFAEAGTAFMGKEGLNLSDLKTDAGIGLYLGITRSSRNVIRIDFAWPFDRDPLNRRGLLITVSGGRSF